MSFIILRNMTVLRSKFHIRTLFPCGGRNLFYLPQRISVPSINLTANKEDHKLLQNKFLIKNISLEQKRLSHGGSHHADWILEKIGSLGLAVLLPTVIVYPCTLLDIVVSVLIAHHHYVGIEQIITDYARPVVIGHTLAKLCEVLNILTTALALVGWILFTKTKMTFAECSKVIWSIGKKSKDECN